MSESRNEKTDLLYSKLNEIVKTENTFRELMVAVFTAFNNNLKNFDKKTREQIEKLIKPYGELSKKNAECERGFNQLVEVLNNQNPNNWNDETLSKALTTFIENVGFNSLEAAAVDYDNFSDFILKLEKSGSEKDKLALKKIEKDLKKNNSLSIQSHLIAAIQRMPRYADLLEAINKELENRTKATPSFLEKTKNKIKKIKVNKEVEEVEGLIPDLKTTSININEKIRMNEKENNIDLIDTRLKLADKMREKSEKISTKILNNKNMSENTKIKEIKKAIKDIKKELNEPLKVIYKNSKVKNKEISKILNLDKISYEIYTMALQNTNLIHFDSAKKESVRDKEKVNFLEKIETKIFSGLNKREKETIQNEVNPTPLKPKDVSEEFKDIHNLWAAQRIIEKQEKFNPPAPSYIPQKPETKNKLSTSTKSFLQGHQKALSHDNHTIPKKVEKKSKNDPEFHPRIPSKNKI